MQAIYKAAPLLGVAALAGLSLATRPAAGAVIVYNLAYNGATAGNGTFDLADYNGAGGDIFLDTNGATLNLTSSWSVSLPGTPPAPGPPSASTPSPAAATSISSQTPPG